MATDQGVLQTVQPAIGVVFSRTPPTLTMRNADSVKKLIGQAWFGVEGLNSDSGGSISVTVKVEGVIQVDMLVRCMHRKTGIEVNAGYTDENGQITFSDLNRDATGEYYVIAFSEQDYNALIYDKLTPV